MDMNYGQQMLQLGQQHSAYDLQSLDHMRKQSMRQDDDSQQAALRQAAQQFEAIFMNQLMSSMRQANEVFAEDNPMNSQYTKFYQGMYDQQLSTELAQHGSLGFADLLVQQLSPDSHQGYQTNAYLAPERLETSMAQRGIQVRHSEQEFSLYERIPALRFADDGQDWQAQSPVEFLERLAPYAMEASKESQVSPVAILAQAALETGWGQRLVPNRDGQSSNNLFNIKAGPSWQGETAQVITQEYENKQKRQEVGLFRAYQQVEDSFRDYVHFLQQNPRYQQALEQGSNPEHFAEGLQQAGYATDPQYAQKLKQIISGQAMQLVRERLGF